MTLPTTGYGTANVTNPSSALTDFTLMIDLSRMHSDWWAAVDTSDGTKGRAAIDSSAVELATDWIDFNSGAETGWLRVKWTGTLASSGTQTLRIYPPNTANTSNAASDTYGRNNAYDSYFEGYWPLQSDFNDRTSHARHLTATGSPTAGDGATAQFGASTDFDGSQYLKKSSLTGVSLEPMTLSAWAKCDPPSDYVANIILSVGNGSSYVEQNLLRVELGTGAYRTRAAAPNGGGDVNTNASMLNSSTAWEMSTGVYDNDTRNVYVNGTAGTANTTSTSATTPDQVVIGARSRTGVNTLTGQIQDAQIHSTVRGTAWIAEEYAQTNSQASFWGTWGWTAGGTDYTLTVDTSSVAVTASDVGLFAVRVVAVDSSAVSVTASDAGLFCGHLLAVDAASVAATAADVSQLYGDAVSVDTSSVAVTASDVVLSVGRVVAVDSSAVSVTAADADLFRGHLLAVDASSVSATASDVSALYGRAMSVDSSSVAVTASDAGLFRGHFLAVGSTSLDVSFSAVGFGAGAVFSRRSMFPRVGSRGVC